MKKVSGVRNYNCLSPFFVGRMYERAISIKKELFHVILFFSDFLSPRVVLLGLVHVRDYPFLGFLLSRFALLGCVLLGLLLLGLSF